MTYVLSAEGTAFITTEEHCELKAYNKDGHWSIGFGHTGQDVKEGDEITREYAIILFNQDVKPILDNLWYKSSDFDQNEVDALTSLFYNCGLGLLRYEHTIGRAISDHDKEATANAILLYDMATINGVRGPFLASRRKAEYEMFNGAKEVSTPSGLFKCVSAQGDVT